MNEMDRLIIVSFVSMLIGLVLGYFLKWETRKQMKDGVSKRELLGLMSKSIN